MKCAYFLHWLFKTSTLNLQAFLAISLSNLRQFKKKFPLLRLYKDKKTSKDYLALRCTGIDAKHTQNTLTTALSKRAESLFPLLIALHNLPDVQDQKSEEKEHHFLQNIINIWFPLDLLSTNPEILFFQDASGCFFLLGKKLLLFYFSHSCTSMDTGSLVPVTFLI